MIYDSGSNEKEVNRCLLDWSGSSLRPFRTVVQDLTVGSRSKCEETGLNQYPEVIDGLPTLRIIDRRSMEGWC